MQIRPNDTILAVPDSGIDPNTVNYITYSYLYNYNERLQSLKNTTSTRLLLYREWCNDLSSITKTRSLSTNYSFMLSERDVSQVEIDNRYLVKGSTIEYRINLTLSPSEPVPPYCYAKVHLSIEEGSLVEDICNDTTATYELTATENSYTPLYLSILSRDVQLQAVDIHANGTVRYYDNTESRDQFACEIDPPRKTSCQIPIYENNNYNDNICILAYLESSDPVDEFTSYFEYDIAAFSYRQVVPLAFICVGLVTFVCTLGLLFICCTRQSRRLRGALRMTSPLQH